MDNAEKIKKLVEDYQKALCIINDLIVQHDKNEKISYSHLLDRNIRNLWWPRFIKSACNLGRSMNSKFPRRLYWDANKSTYENNIKYTDTLALYDYKIAVYTCIIGEYDQLQEPLFMPSNVDYILVTDGQISSTGSWKGIDVRTIKGIPALDNSRVSRYVKLHPHLFLNDYDYSIYIDGNIKTIGDMRYLINLMNKHGFVSNLHRKRECLYEEIKACVRQNKDNAQTTQKQIESYRIEGMPEHYGLIEASLLVRDHHNPVCIKIMESWWQEIIKHSRRDQLSLPFVLWNMGIPIPEIGRISNNVYKIPLIRVYPHLRG